MIIEKARELNSLNTFRVSATASYYAKIKTKPELIEALTFADQNNLEKAIELFKKALLFKPHEA